jgi:hypothetical protein
MKFRIRAFSLHLLGSACALGLVLGSLYLGWYRWPGWYLASAVHVVGILVMVDLVIGPTLTLVVANPGKPRRELARDVAIIVTVQLAALIYGAATLWGGRPLYYTFSTNSLDMVQADDVEDAEITLARQQNPSLAPHWYSRPRWVWAPLPDDPQEAMNIVGEATLGSGKDIVDMPSRFKPWDEGLPKLRDQLSRLDDIKYLSKAEKQTLRSRLARRGLAADERNALIMWGASRRVLAIFDTRTLRIEALLKAD